MKNLLMAAVVALLPVGAFAHDFSELKIDRFARIENGPFLEIILGNTVKGRQIVCAILNGSGQILATTQWITDNFATKVVISYEGVDVGTAQCVFND